jgi:hypothetical protein
MRSVRLSHLQSSRPHYLYCQPYVPAKCQRSSVNLSPDPFLDAHHRFIAEECDWGFTRFSELRKLFTIQEGHSRPTIEEECADVSVFVRVLEDPTGVLWHNFVKCEPLETSSSQSTHYLRL